MTDSYKNKPFLTRQADYLINLEERKCDLETKEGEKFKDYFKPKIGRSEEVLMKNRPEVVCESKKVSD